MFWKTIAIWSSKKSTWQPYPTNLKIRLRSLTRALFTTKLSEVPKRSTKSIWKRLRKCRKNDYMMSSWSDKQRHKSPWFETLSRSPLLFRVHRVMILRLKILEAAVSICDVIQSHQVTVFKMILTWRLYASNGVHAALHPNEPSCQNWFIEYTAKVCASVVIKRLSDSLKNLRV